MTELLAAAIEPSMAALRAEADALCANPAFRAALWRHCGRADNETYNNLSTRIHRDDPMLWHSLRVHREANRSVSQYFSVALQQHDAFQQVLRAFFGSNLDSRSVLDFACGHGRNLRFAGLALPASAVWGSDIQKEAVDFCTAEFGVQGLYSSADPDAFQPGRSFDLIWVASLFSHLPADLFHRWLHRLGALLTDDGVLCFSVLGERILSSNVAMSAEGIHFVPSSENAMLDTSIYGTTFVTDTYVRQALAGASRVLGSSWRIARGLANEQDLYVVARTDRDLTALAGFRHGPWGWVDKLDASGQGQLRIQGWAGSLDDGALGEIEVRVDGKLYRVPTDVRRDDVAQVLGDERLAFTGFDFRHKLDASSRPIFLEVTARSSRDELAMIYAGPVGGTI